jgi:DNA gyrase/topoisomerase IV subunit B
MVSDDPAAWSITTHDWAAGVDREHLAGIRANPARYCPGGLLHLVLEVTAYANDEAEALGRAGRCAVTLSQWLTHTNRCHDGAWTQRYDHGIPVSDLERVPTIPDTGTTVRFLVDHLLVPEARLAPDLIRQHARFPWLSVDVVTE